MVTFLQKFKGITSFVLTIYLLHSRVIPNVLTNARSGLIVLLVLASNKSRCDPHLTWSTFNMKPHRLVAPLGTPIFILFFF